MAKIRFIHCSDLHIDTPFKGLSQLNNTLANRLKNATTKSLDNIVNLCIKENADFLLIAGDIFNSDQQSLSAQLNFAKALNRLNNNNIPVYFSCGNHDPLNSWLSTLHLPDSAVRLGGKEIEKHSIVKNGKIIADLYGISYLKKEVSTNLAKGFETTEPNAPFSIAMLHGTVGQAGKHIPYAPFSLEDIKNKPFDYWALGHIHKHNVIKDAHPAIVYPGNPQGRDFGETGEKGCYLVELESGSKPKLEFKQLQTIRFEEANVNIEGINDIGSLNRAVENIISDLTVNQDVDFLLRITLQGRTGLHKQLSAKGEIQNIQQSINDGFANNTPFVFIDSIYLQTSPDIDLKQLEKGTDFTAELYRTFLELKNKTEISESYISEIMDELPSQVKKELSDDDNSVEITANETEELLEKAKWLLLDQLIKE